MKKFYVTHHILVGLLAISFSLSGMITNDNQLTKINFEAPLTIQRSLTLNHKKPVFLVSDKSNTNFILKFQKDPLKGIFDTLGAEVGKNRVDMNQVQIFPPHYFHDKLLIVQQYATNKKLHHYTSTLHTYIENDDDVTKTSPIYRAIDKKDQLYMASIYKNLAPMIALNIYVNNVDCRDANILFNSKENKYYLIDMDCCFIHILYPDDYTTIEYDLARYTSLNLNFMYLEPIHIEALKRVNITLNELIEQYPPHTLLELFTKIAYETEWIYDEDEQKEILSEFETYYEKNKKLHSQINTLIGYKDKA